MRVLVTGSRRWTDRETIWEDLDALSPSVVIHGGARGADRIAAAWAETRGATVIEVPAQWELEGKAAGPLRNQRMLLLGPDLVLAYPLGVSPGTRDMMRRARRAGVPVRVWGEA